MPKVFFIFQKSDAMVHLLTMITTIVSMHLIPTQDGISYFMNEVREEKKFQLYSRPFNVRKAHFSGAQGPQAGELGNRNRSSGTFFDTNVRITRKIKRRSPFFSILETFLTRDACVRPPSTSPSWWTTPGLRTRSSQLERNRT